MSRANVSSQGAPQSSLLWFQKTGSDAQQTFSPFVRLSWECPYLGQAFPLMQQKVSLVPQLLARCPYSMQVSLYTLKIFLLWFLLTADVHNPFVSHSPFPPVLIVAAPEASLDFRRVIKPP